MQQTTPATEKKHAKVVVTLLGLVFFMAGFGFALAPLYEVFCDITGLNGRTATTPAVVSETQVNTDRTVKVQFITNLSNNAPWEFQSDVFAMEVHPGQLNETVFYAKNLTDKTKVAQAVPSVAPGQASSYLHKTECFCFNEQAFEPGEGKKMPLRFMVDPQLPEKYTALTLSYTFFELDKMIGQSN